MRTEIPSNDRRYVKNDEVEQTKIFPLIADSGNRELLLDWIEDRDAYELADETDGTFLPNFDCLICDSGSLWEHRGTLIERKQNEPILLPYVLLVEKSRERNVREELRNEHPELWQAIDAIVEMPIAEYRLDDQLRNLARMRGQSRNILAQQQQLEAIRDEHAGHGIVITDVDGDILSVNKAFETQSGYHQDEVIGENPRILKSGEHDEEFYEDLWDTILAGDVWQAEIINERKDGTQYVLDQTIAPVENSAGEIERLIAVNHEITQLKNLEHSLRAQREQLAILNRVLRHDIRNDLHVMLGWSDALTKHVDEPGTEYIQRIKRSGEHIIELTEVAKEIAEAVFADTDPDLQPTDLAQVLEEEVQKRRETFDGATIAFTDSPPQGTEIWANEMLSSVFRNLINNAVQHNDSEDPTVDISTRMTDETVEIRIADDGPGIPEEQREEIFDESRKGLDSEGTGMGLFLVHSIVESYGGTVSVEDNEPRGVVFAVELRTVESSDVAGVEL